MRVFLNGGGCGKQTIDTYKEINKIIDHEKPVLYVPLAIDETDHPYDDCFEWIKSEISVIDVPNIEMVRTFNEFYEKDYNKYSMIFIGGGNIGNNAISAPISLIAFQRLTFSNQSLFVSGIIYAF